MPGNVHSPKVHRTRTPALRLAAQERAHGRAIPQEGLAELAGLHRTYVRSVERGERHIAVDHMEALANALELDISELLRLPTAHGKFGASRSCGA